MRPHFGAHRQAILLPCVLALTLVACSKGAPEPAKARTSASAPQPRVEPSVPARAPEVNEALKDRLARQEAASKLFDKSNPEPAPVAKAAPVEAPKVARATVPVSALPPVKSVPAPVKAVPVEAPKAAPAQVTAAVVVPATVPAAAPATSVIAPAKLISRSELEFPREAIQAGVDRGLVKARMTLDTNGNVTKVEVIEANPRRLFDRVVVRSLGNWRFNEGPPGRTVETEVEFRR